MKTINKFFEEAHLFKVFLFGWLITGLFTFGLFEFITQIPGLANETGKHLLTTIVNLKIGVTIGLPFGLMVMLGTSMSRKSTKFWNYSEIVEEIVKKAETKAELKSVYDNEFQTLRRLAQGGPHYAKVKEIYTIINTKYDYLK